ncbi:hypothetical protein BDF19DRAFT_116931 [Syncephalis fuscata]|nr:hypothetical protein BDF19DRAFT_116931 [Syncephalis fuscata]
MFSLRRWNSRPDTMVDGISAIRPSMIFHLMKIIAIVSLLSIQFAYATDVDNNVALVQQPDNTSVLSSSIKSNLLFLKSLPRDSNELVIQQGTSNVPAKLSKRNKDIPGWFPAEQQFAVSSSTAAFTSSLTVNVIVGVFLYLVFSLVRPWNVYYYAPRMIAKYVQAPRSITGQFYHWVIVTIRTPDRELLRNAGLDAYMFLRFLRLSRRLFIIYCVIGLPIMMPLNIIDQGDLDGVQEWTVGNVTNPRRFWGHVVCSYLFVCIAMFYMVRELNVYIRLRHAYLTSSGYRKRPEATTMLITGLPAKIRFDQERRLRHIYSKVPGGLRSVLTVRRSIQVGLAKTRRDKIHQQLEAAICHYVTSGVRPQVKQSFWPFGRHRSTPVQPSQPSETNEDQINGNTDNQPKGKQQQSNQDIEMIDKSKFDAAIPTDDIKSQVLEKLEETMVKISDKPNHYASPESGDVSDDIPVDQRNSAIMNMETGEPLDPSRDLILNLALALCKQERELEKVRTKANNQTTRYHIASTAFIRFRTQLGAQLAAQAVGFGTPLRGWPRFVGVRAEDVLWRNLRVLRWERWIRKGISFSASFFLTLFWAALVTLTSSVATLSSLSGVLPFLKPLLNLPKPILGFIEGIVPQVIIFFLMAFVPYILYFLSIFEGIPLYSRVYLTLMQRYFLFQIVNILLVGTFATGIFTALSSILNEPTLTLTILARAMPNSSTFFINYVLLLALFGSAKELLRIPTLFVRWSRRPFTKFDTPRKVLQRRRLPEMEWGRIYPNAAFIFCTGYVYSTIAPLILPFVVIYFTLHHVVFRYQFLYVYASHRGSAARAFPKAISHIFAGIYIQQLTLMGIMILREQVALSVMQGLLVAFTIMAHVYMNKGFGMGTAGLIEYIPLELLADVEDQELRGLRSPERDRSGYDGDVGSNSFNVGQQSQLSDVFNGRDGIMDMGPSSTEQGAIPGINLGIVSAMDHTTSMEVHDLINVFSENGSKLHHPSQHSSLEMATEKPSTKATGKQIMSTAAEANKLTKRRLHKERLNEMDYELGELESSMNTSWNQSRAEQQARTREEAAEIEMIIEGEMGEWDNMDEVMMKNAMVSEEEEQQQLLLNDNDNDTLSIPRIQSTEDTVAEITARLEVLHDTQNRRKNTSGSSRTSSSTSPQLGEPTDTTSMSNYGLFPHAGAILVETTTVTRPETSETLTAESNVLAPSSSTAAGQQTTTATQSYVVMVPGRNEEQRTTIRSHANGAETPQRQRALQQSMEMRRSGNYAEGTPTHSRSRRNSLTIRIPGKAPRSAMLSPMDAQSPSQRDANLFLDPSGMAGDQQTPRHRHARHHRRPRHDSSAMEIEDDGEDDDEYQYHPEGHHWESDDGEDALREQYTRPRFRRQPPVIWIPQDEAGRAEQECRRMQALGIPVTCKDAELRKKGRRQYIAIHRVDVPTLPVLPSTTRPL